MAGSRSGPGTRDSASSAKKLPTASTWKLDSGCPPKYCSATIRASATIGSAPRRCTTWCTPSSSHGSHAHTLLSGHESHTTKNSPKP